MMLLLVLFLVMTILFQLKIEDWYEEVTDKHNLAVVWLYVAQVFLLNYY